MLNLDEQMTDLVNSYAALFTVLNFVYKWQKPHKI